MKTCSLLRAHLNLEIPCCIRCHAKGMLEAITIDGEDYELCCDLLDYVVKKCSDRVTATKAN
jgi:hypothetical protein